MLSDAPGISALPPSPPVCMITHYDESSDSAPSADIKSTFDGQGMNHPTLLRPELTGPFNALAHKVEDFNFTPTTSGFCQPWTQRSRARSKRQSKKRQGKNPEQAQIRCFVDTTHMSPMTAFKVAARLVAARRSPRKRAMLEPPAAADDDAPVEFEDIYDDLSMDLWDAKASIRKHLLDISPVHTAATKRRVNGLERNWIRAHQMDPDVKFLLQFPGDIAADKARELIAMRDLIPLEYVEEADGSLVMTMEPVPQASLTSSASRLEKLDMATSKMMEKEALLNSEDVVVREDTEPNDNAAEYLEEPDEASELSIVVTPTSIQVCSTPKCPGSSPVKSPVKRRCPGMSPRTLKTPKASAQHEILDVDLHEQPDIFASAVSKRHKETTPAVPIQLSWLAATPRPFSPVDASLQIDESTDAQWSPMVFTPTQTTELSPALSDSHADHTPASPSKQPPVSQAEARETLESSSSNVAQQVHSIPSTPQPSGASEQLQDSQPKVPAITITVQATPETAADSGPEMEAPQQAPVQDDDRTFLLQFMNKHHAVKSRAVMTSPITHAAPVTRHEPATTAPGTPRTPDAAPIRMWVDAPEVASDRKSREHETPVKSSASRKRAPLAPLDSNSPSPVKARVGKRKLEEEPEESKPDRNREDGGEQAPEPSPKRRRGLRARKPTAPSAPLAANARAVRSGEKDLASLTRANTRANKGTASMPEEVLERFAADPMGQKWKERKEVVDAKAARAASASVHGKARSKNVRWAETLAQFREGSPVPEEDEDSGEMIEEEEEEETTAVVAPFEDDFIPKKPARASKAKQAVPAPTPVIPKTPPKSKLPAPTRRAAPATPAAVGKKPVRSAQPARPQHKEGVETVKPRPTRAAAQKSNLSMGLTATGTPIRKGRGRPRSVK